MTHHFIRSVNRSIEAEIVVVGAGLVGLSAAIAFAQQGRNVALVDSKKPAIKQKKTWDERVYALTPATENWLKSIGVWAHVETSRVNAIHTMHLFNDATENPLVLRDEDANLSKLGLIIENQNLLSALWQQLKALDVTVITDASCESLHNAQQQVALGLVNGQQISAQLIVAADGLNSWVRSQVNISVVKKDFHQTAIVANFNAEKVHSNVARQWFAPHDVLALLPLPDKLVSMVWSVPTEKAAQLLALSQEVFAQNVYDHSKGVLGELKQVGESASFVLNQLTTTSLIAKRVVLIGDAAHQIHPMAGQGLNLGFRDVMQLTGLTTECHAMQNVGDATLLRRYERARKADMMTMNSLTSGLDYLFANNIGIAKQVANWGLRKLNGQAIIKKLLIQQAVA